MTKQAMSMELKRHPKQCCELQHVMSFLTRFSLENAAERNNASNILVIIYIVNAPCSLDLHKPWDGCAEKHEVFRVLWF